MKCTYVYNGMIFDSEESLGDYLLYQSGLSESEFSKLKEMSFRDLIDKSGVIKNTLYDLEPNLSEEKIQSIYNNYVNLMGIKREGKEMSYDAFKKLLGTYQVFNYGDTYIFGTYDAKNAVFVTRMNSSPSSKELLAVAIPKLVESGLDFISFVPEDYAKKLVRSGYTMSTNSFDYDFKGEQMNKFAVTSNPNIFMKIFDKDPSNVSSAELESFNESIELKYTPVDIDSKLIVKAGKDLSKILETYLNQFGIVVKDIDEIKSQLDIDELGFADLLSKIAYVKDKSNLPPVAGEFIAFMMQHNSLVKDIILELSQDKNYKGLDKSQYFKIIGELIAKDLQNKLEGNYSKSLIDKLKDLIDRFFNLIKTTPIDKININVGIISNNILQQNKNLITASKYKPGAQGKPVKQVSIEEALQKDEFGANIIYKLSKYGFILTGSTAISEQGSILRPNENPLHDIDWQSPFVRSETISKFLEAYPDAIKTNEIINDEYVTDSFIIVPDGYKIKDLNIKNVNGKRFIESYRVVNKNDTVVGSYDLIYNPNFNTNEEFVKGVQGKVIDFFSHENPNDDHFLYKSESGNDIKLGTWKSVFKAKLDWARYKDIWDYNRFVPNENLNELAIREDIDRKIATDDNLKAKYFQDSNTVSTVEVLEKIAKSNHPLNKLAQSMLSKGVFKNVPITIVPGRFVNEARRSTATYNTMTGEIKIAAYGRFRAGQAEHALMHEIIHAHTANFIFSNPNDPNVLALQAVYKQAVKSIEGNKYGLYSLDEFVAEAFTNSNFMKDLRSLPPVNDVHDNLFTEFLNIILKFLGLTPTKSMLDEVYYLTDAIMDEYKANVEQKGSGQTLAMEEEDLESPKGRVLGENRKPIVKKSISKPKFEISTSIYTRNSVEMDTNSMYLFTDNAERTSKPNAKTENVDTDSWYYKKYKSQTDKPLHYGTLSNPTSAVIRGLNNAYPISTMSAYGTNWTDDNFDLFEEVITDEIDQIKKDMSNFSTIKIGDYRIGQGGRFAKLPKQHQAFLDVKLLELGIDNSGDKPKIINESSEQTSTSDNKSYKVEVYNGNWTRSIVANTPNKTFLFGDNFDQMDTNEYPSFTQAVIRGLPNAIGIPTKNDKGTSSSSYLTDEDFDRFKEVVDAKIKEAVDKGKPIVIPADGIGTGKAKLATTAPRLFAYLEEKLNELKSQGIKKDTTVRTVSQFSSTPNFEKLPSRSNVPTMTYAGIGTRGDKGKLPPDVKKAILRISKELETLGFVANTGDAIGTDKLFADNVTSNVFTAKHANEFTVEVAREIHPHPEAIDMNSNTTAEQKEYVWNLMARNTNQVFGLNLDTPVDFVLAYEPQGWTGGALRPTKGGTNQAIDMAYRKGIPVINVANDGWESKLREVLEDVASRRQVNQSSPGVIISTNKQRGLGFQLSPTHYVIRNGKTEFDITPDPNMELTDPFEVPLRQIDPWMEKKGHKTYGDVYGHSVMGWFLANNSEAVSVATEEDFNDPEFDFDMMVELLETKFRQYPDLSLLVRTFGGTEFLEKSSTNDETLDKAIRKAYENVKNDIDSFEEELETSYLKESEEIDYTIDSNQVTKGYTNTQIDDIIKSMLYAMTIALEEEGNRIEDINQLSLNDAVEFLEYLSDLYSEEGDSPNEVLHSRVEAILTDEDALNYFLNRLKKKIYKISNVEINDYQDEAIADQEPTETDNSLGLVESYELDTFVRATPMIRFIMSTIPDIKTVDSNGEYVFNTNNYLGITSLTNYGNLFKNVITILENFTNYDKDGRMIDSFEAMMILLKNKMHLYPEIKFLVERLEGASENVQSQFVRTFDQTKANYTDHLLDAVNKISKIAESNNQTVSATIHSEWAANFAKLFGVEKNGVIFYNQVAIDRVIANINKLRLDFAMSKDRDDLKDFVKIKSQIFKILNELGVSVSPATLEISFDNLKNLNLHEITGDMTQEEIRMYSNSNDRQKLSVFIEGLINATKNLSGNKSNLQLDYRTNHMVRETSFFRDVIAKAHSTGIKQRGEDQVAGPDGKKKSKAQYHNNITKLVAEMKSGSTRYVEMLFNDPFSRDSYWLNSMYERNEAGKIVPKKDLDGNVIIEKFDITLYNLFKLEGVGDGGDKFSNLKEPDQALDVLVKYMKGHAVGLAEADKTQQFYFKNAPVNKTDFEVEGDTISYTIDQFGDEYDEPFAFTYFKDHIMSEWNRMAIEETRLDNWDKDPSNKDKEVEHYHYGKVPGDRKGNYKKLYLMPDLTVDELVELGILDEVTKKPNTPDRNTLNSDTWNELLKDEFEKAFRSDLQYFTEMGIIGRYRSGSYKNLMISRELFSEKGNALKMKFDKNKVENLIAEFTFMSIMTNIEQMKMFNGDPAMYKGKDSDPFSDLMKRIPALTASGIQAAIKDIKSYTSAVSKDIKVPSEYFTDSKSHELIAKATGLSVSEVSKLYTGQDKYDPKKKGSAYADVDRTDAQAWILPEVWRQRLKYFGKWSDVHDIIYDKLVNNESLTYAEAKIAAQPLKTVHVERIWKEGVPMMIYNKQSEALIFKQLVKGGELEKVYNAMKRDGVDHLIANSGRKVGGIGVADITTDDFKLTPVNLSYNHLMLQQDLPTKGMKQILTGTQMIKNVMLTITDKDIYDEYLDVNGQLSDRGLIKFLDSIEYDPDTKRYNRDKIYSMLKESFEGDVSDNIINALEAGLEMDTIIGIKEKIQNRLMALINNKTVLLKSNGMALIQMSDFGTMKLDQIDRSKKVGNGIILLEDRTGIPGLRPMMLEEGKDQATPAEILVPFSIVEKYFEKLGLNIHSMTHEEVTKLIDPKLLEGIAYRIPNQGPSSNTAVKVVGILPAWVGDQAIMYKEITTQTGSDFDIDKSFMLFPEYNVANIKNLKRVKEKGVDIIKFDFKGRPHAIYDSDRALLDFYLSRENSFDYVIKYIHPRGTVDNMTEDQLKNRRLELINKMLRNPEVFNLVTAPLDRDELKSWADQYFPTIKSDSKMNFWTGTQQLRNKALFDKAKALVGVVANHMTHHAAILHENIEGYSNVNNVDGENIALILSEYMNAIVDAVKDPYITRINVNLQTANVVFMLTRKGYSQSQILSFINQPIIKELVQLREINEARISEDNLGDPIKYLQTKYLDRLKKITKSNKNVDYPEFGNFMAFDKSDAMKIIKDYNEEDASHIQFQLSTLLLFSEVSNEAKDLNDVINSMKSDVRGAGKNLTQARLINDLYESIAKGESPWAAVLNEREGTSHFLSKYHKNSVQTALAIFGTETLDQTIAFRTAANYLLAHRYSVDDKRLTMNVTTASQLLDNINKELFASLLSEYDEFKMESKEQLLEFIFGSEEAASFSDEIEYMKKLFKSKGIRNNVLELLSEEYDYSDKFSYYYIKGNVSQDLKDELYKDWEDLLENYPEFGNNLIKYSYYTSGFRNNFGSFFQYIPTSWLAKENGLNDFIKEKRAELANDPYYFMQSNKLDKVAAHLMSNSDIVRLVNKNMIASADNGIIDLKKEFKSTPSYIKIPSKSSSEDYNEEEDVPVSYTLYKRLGDGSYAMIPMFGKLMSRSVIKEYTDFESSIFLSNYALDDPGFVKKMDKYRSAVEQAVVPKTTLNYYLGSNTEVSPLSSEELREAYEKCIRGN